MPTPPHFFADRTMTHAEPDVPRPGFVDLAAIPANRSISEDEFRRCLAAASGISETDGASLTAATYALIASGAVKSRRVGASRIFTRVRRYGPVSHQPAFHSLEDDDGGLGGDAAYRRAKQSEQRRQDERLRRIVQEELRAAGVTQ